MKTPAPGPKEMDRAVRADVKAGIWAVTVREASGNILRKEEVRAQLAQAEQQDRKKEGRGDQSFHQN
jgi:hypothetical protein